MAKYYNFDSVMDSCSSGSSIDNSLTEAQINLDELYSTIKELENIYHGIGRCQKYDSYKQLYDGIGSANYGGAWSAIRVTIDTLNSLYSIASRDKYIWEEEQRRLREEVERRAREAAMMNTTVTYRTRWWM